MTDCANCRSSLPRIGERHGVLPGGQGLPHEHGRFDFIDAPLMHLTSSRSFRTFTATLELGSSARLSS